MLPIYPTHFEDILFLLLLVMLLVMLNRRLVSSKLEVVDGQEGGYEGRGGKDCPMPGHILKKLHAKIRSNIEILLERRQRPSWRRGVNGRGHLEWLSGCEMMSLIFESWLLRAKNLQRRGCGSHLLNRCSILRHGCGLCDAPKTSLFGRQIEICLDKTRPECCHIVVRLQDHFPSARHHRRFEKPSQRMPRLIRDTLVSSFFPHPSASSPTSTTEAVHRPRGSPRICVPVHRREGEKRWMRVATDLDDGLLDGAATEYFVHRCLALDRRRRVRMRGMWVRNGASRQPLTIQSFPGSGSVAKRVSHEPLSSEQNATSNYERCGGRNPPCSVQERLEFPSTEVSARQGAAQPSFQKDFKPLAAGSSFRPECLYTRGERARPSTHPKQVFEQQQAGFFVSGLDLELNPGHVQSTEGFRDGSRIRREEELAGLEWTGEGKWLGRRAGTDQELNFPS